MSYRLKAFVQTNRLFYLYFPSLEHKILKTELESKISFLKVSKYNMLKMTVSR